MIFFYESSFLACIKIHHDFRHGSAYAVYDCCINITLDICFCSLLFMYTTDLWMLERTTESRTVVSLPNTMTLEYATTPFNNN